MKCRKCGQNNVENSKFCNNCGTNLEDGSIIKRIKSIIQFKTLKVFDFKNKKVICISITTLLVLVLLSVSIFKITNPVARFKTAVKSNNIEQAKYIYDNHKYNDKMIGFVKNYISDIEEDFKNDKISYDNAMDKLNNIQDLDIAKVELKAAKAYIPSLNTSRLAFEKAEEYLKQNDYVNALKEYNNVIQTDVNYKSAQKSISENKEKYKTEVLNTVDEFTEQRKYNETVQLLNTAAKILSDDNDIISKLEVSKTQQKEEVKANQLLVVDSANILIQSTQWKYAYPDMLQAFVTNKSDKTVKDMNIGFLAYDSNGYPLKIAMQYSIAGDNFEFVGNADNINLISGNQFGYGKGWNLDPNHGISIVKACVKDAIFYDGTKWTNPYYEYWLQEYKEKQIQE